MSPGLQDVLVTLAAVGALAWLIRRRIRRGSESACENCPATTAREPASDFVPLETLAVRGAENRPGSPD